MLTIKITKHRKRKYDPSDVIPVWYGYQIITGMGEIVAAGDGSATRKDAMRRAGIVKANIGWYGSNSSI